MISWENLIKNKLKHFNESEHFINVIMFGENWCWSQLRLKGLTVRELAAWFWQTEMYTCSISYTVICKYLIIILAPFAHKQNFMLQVCNLKYYKTDMSNYRRLYERPRNKVTRKT